MSLFWVEGVALCPAVCQINMAISQQIFSRIALNYLECCPAWFSRHLGWHQDFLLKIRSSSTLGTFKMESAVEPEIFFYTSLRKPKIAQSIAHCMPQWVLHCADDVIFMQTKFFLRTTISNQNFKRDRNRRKYSS